MKEAIVTTNIAVTIKDVPQPKPGPGQVLVKVVAFGTNPKDWKIPELLEKEHNSGDDVAGYVEDVGKNVYEFKKGDRVAGFHVMMTEHGAFAEFALTPASTTFHIPKSTSFEEAATVPLAALTSAFGLFRDLNLPAPYNRQEGKQQHPLIVYGASSAVGAFAIKLAAKANLHPIIAVGSSSSSFVSGFLDEGKGDALVDYKAHSSQDELCKAIDEALVKAKVPQGAVVDAFDGVSESGSYAVLSQVLAGRADTATGRRARISHVLNMEDGQVDRSVEPVHTMVGSVHADGDLTGQLFGSIWSRLLGVGLEEGWMPAHPHQVMPKGLLGLEGALGALKAGNVRAKKMVGRIEETPA